MTNMEQIMEQQEEALLDNVKDLNGIQKAAVLLISFGVEKASKVLKELKEHEVEKLSRTIADLDNVSPDVVESVREEYYALMRSKKFIVGGGKEYAQDLLTQSLGQSKADEILKQLDQENGTDAFGIFQAADMNQIVNFLKGEHPQVAAVILAHLKTSKSAEILTNLPSDFQGEVAIRLAKMGNISSEVIEELEEVIKDQIETEFSEREHVQKGSSAVASILNDANITTERNVLSAIENVDKELAREIKDQMFLFEDIIELDDRNMQVVVSKLDKQDMVIGLKGISDELKNKFLDNMSQRAREILVDDIEATGAVHLKKVEEAQQNIVRAIKELDEEGKISIRKDNQESFVE